MRDIIERAWQQTEPPDWPTQDDMDELAAEWTEGEWEAEQARIMDACYGPLPTRGEPRPYTAGVEEPT